MLNMIRMTGESTRINMEYIRKEKYNKEKVEDLKKVELYLKKINELHVNNRTK